MKSSKRVFSMLLCITVLLVVVFSAFYIVAEVGHDCAGEHCAICHQAEFCKNLLRVLALSVSAIGVAVVSKPLHPYPDETRHTKVPVPTLVALGVKLSD